jgi:hypothetical protein
VCSISYYSIPMYRIYTNIEGLRTDLFNWSLHQKDKVGLRGIVKD